MIVIVIIGVVYTLVISKINSSTKEKITPSFLNLKEYLYSFLGSDDKEAKLICLDSCQKCSIYVDNKKVKSIKSFFDSSVESYSYDFLLGTQKISYDVCFSFGIDKDRVSDQTLVVYKDKTYDYTSYFQQTKVYDSLNEATEAKQNLIQSVTQ